MAFAQQQKRPRYNRHIPSSSSEEYSDYLQQQQDQQEEHLVLQRTYRNNSITTVSDSDTDWHVLSSTSQSSNITSPVLFASSSESSIRLVSDISEDESIEQQQQTNAFLPSHDGTGTFLNELDQQLTTSSSLNETREFASAVNRLMLPFTTDEEDDEEEQDKSKDSSVIDFTLPFGGIRPPSFIPMNVEPPNFVPTAAGLNSQELTNGVLSGENHSDSSITNEKHHHDNREIQYIIKDKSIPIHHSGSSGGIPAALLSIIMNNLRRLRDHLLENDTNTAETLGQLMSEAVFEGCIPFGSHLHMEFDNTLRSSTSYSFFEGNIAI